MDSHAYCSYADEAAAVLLTFLESLGGTVETGSAADEGGILPLAVTFSDASTLEITATVDRSKVVPAIDMSRILLTWFADGTTSAPPPTIGRIHDVADVALQILKAGPLSTEALELRNTVISELMSPDLDLVSYNDLLDRMVATGLYHIHTGREKRLETEEREDATPGEDERNNPSDDTFVLDLGGEAGWDEF
jgi:hypothetical protein